MDQLLQQIHAFLAWKVAAGMENDEELVQGAADAFEDQMTRTELLSVVRAEVAPLIEEHRSAEAAWPQTTDCDRLDSAFAELDQQGILARQDYWCCSNCGHSAAWAEVKLAKGQRPVKGYVFYHEQDTERAVYGSFHLAYGALENTEEALVAVAQTIIGTLEQFGITTEWNGQTNTRILIKNFDWKRRRNRPPKTISSPSPQLRKHRWQFWK